MSISLSEPATPELFRRIQAIPSVLEILETRSGPVSPLVARLTAILEEGADVAETAYLIETLPGVQSVDE